MDRDPATEVLADLIRGAWVIEAARAEVYRTWGRDDDRFVDAAGRAEAAADLVAEALEEHGRRPDAGLVEPHARWMRDLAGERADEVALGDWFLARLGDWVDAHAGSFLGSRRERLKELCDADKLTLRWPERMPEPPELEPVPPVRARPPGDVIFRFGILGDIHIGSPQGERMARAAIQDLNSSGAELVVQLGDITDHGNKDEFQRATKVLESLDVPYQCMVGNHDMYSYDEERLSGREYFASFFGREPDGLLFEHRGFRFALLDSAENLMSPFGPYNLITGEFMEGDGGAIVRGALTVRQHDLLAEVAAPGAPPAFVFLHHPPQPFTSFPPVVFGLRDADTGRLHAMCDSGNVWGVFAGHTHRNKRSGPFGPVPAQEVAIARDFPFGYALVDVTADGYAYRFVQLSDDELLRESYRAAGQIHRRYGKGADSDRGFVWTK